MNRRVSVAIATLVIVESLAYPLAVWLLSLSAPDYSHMRDQISELGVAGLPYAWVLTAMLVVDAVLLLGLALAVHFCIGDKDRNRWAARLLGLFAFTLLIGGLFPCDEDCRPTTFAGLMHVLNLLPSLVATIGAPFLMRKKFLEDPRLSIFATLSFVLGVLVTVAILAAMSVFPMLDLAGLGQRIVLVFQLGFIVLTAVAVIRVNTASNAD